MTKKIYLEPQKSVLGRSILHYCCLFFPDGIITWEAAIIKFGLKKYFFKGYSMGTPTNFNIHMSILISAKFYALVTVWAIPP